MIKMTSDELRNKYLSFFEERGHTIIPSASLIPENDPTVLFTTAGMHPLVPYLLGEKHPGGTRLTDIQICVRTGDIDEVGDATHCTFFEMLGNWSLNDYFKKEAITWSYEFLTKVLKIDKNNIAVTVFAGNENAPKDEYSYGIWKDVGIRKENIFFMDAKHNWWGPAGETGPCGPDTEIFIDLRPNEKPSFPDDSRYVEIWNNVFMEFYKDDKGKINLGTRKNVDTGMGLERVICILNGFKSVYDTDLFADVIKYLNEHIGANVELSEDEKVKAVRIIADHLRTATFMLGDVKGITPSNVDQGYVLRRLIRRAMRYMRLIDIGNEHICNISKIYVAKYKDVYSFLKTNETKIYDELSKEIDKFSKTIELGLKEFEKVLKYVNENIFPGKTAFRLYDTFGFPIEMTKELAKEKGYDVDEDGYNAAIEAHREKSKQGAEKKFKGGLADDGEMSKKLHTATHLLNKALKTVLKDENINQRGSNITPERLRFDFNFERPLTQDEIKKVEDFVNKEIQNDSIVKCEEMSVSEAKEQGAVGIFTDRYSDIVKVYTIGPSKEICGGPHVEHTAELGEFKIVKEQSSSQGVRRIKAILTE